MTLSAKTKEATEKLTHLTIKRIADRVRADIPLTDYPKVTAVESGGSVYRKDLGEIQIDVIEGGSPIDSIGEEASHFVREYLIAQKDLPKDKRATEEFFGYLGKRAIAEKDKRRLEPPISRKEALSSSKKFRANERHYAKLVNLYEDMISSLEGIEDSKEKQLEFTANQTDRNRILDKIIEVKKEKLEKGKKRNEAEREGQRNRFSRGSYLFHARGYGFASEMDLEQTDLGEVFHLDDSEVRRRFFRKDKRYSATQEVAPKKRGLEETLGIFFASIILLILGSGGITGNVVGISIIRTPFEKLLIVIGIIGIIGSISKLVTLNHTNQ